LQTAFNLQLTASLKALTSGSGAFWWLGGVSFLYGIAHAAGPGHGKVVISSYLVANEERLRRGVLIAFLAAFVQALVAVGIIGAMAAILDMTSAAITDAAKFFEAGSFALVALLGLYLLVRKGREAWTTFRSGDSHTRHHHAESPSALRGGASCHQHHVPLAAEKPGIAGAAAAVLSVGIRPCSGALVVLVFALAQGVFWAGVASTFLMALGTAITVAALAALTVGAKDVARRLTQGDGRRAGQVMLALEGVAALFITLLGAALFAGSISA
jgi:ABC-type nickel/cobalt efflux system permease component RcnA